jgi:hypothetical protein
VQEHKEFLGKASEHYRKHQSMSEEKRQSLEQNLDGLLKSKESEQKYRQMVVKDWAEMMKDIDRQHIKSVTALKHLSVRLESMKRMRAALFSSRQTGLMKAE